MGENKKGFGERHYWRAFVVRKIYHMVGAPHFRNLNMMIRQKIIEYFSAKVRDIEIAEKIFG